jgi:hypothetical protein
MRKYIWIALGVGLLYLTVIMPYWPFVLFYTGVIWLTCPHYNFLSAYCGEITAGFVLSRIAQVLFITALAHLLWQLITKKGNRNE